ncbi:MAG: DUF5522 domain-containing protein [Pyrinomonadaceae bacterium]
MSEALVEGEDYYWEGAAMVFTARFHLRRGRCCESGCRHCPYGFRRGEEADEEAGTEDEAAGCDAYSVS